MLKIYKTIFSLLSCLCMISNAIYWRQIFIILPNINHENKINFQILCQHQGVVYGRYHHAADHIYIGIQNIVDPNITDMHIQHQCLLNQNQDSRNVYYSFFCDTSQALSSSLAIKIYYYLASCLLSSSKDKDEACQCIDHCINKLISYIEACSKSSRDYSNKIQQLQKKIFFLNIIRSIISMQHIAWNQALYTLHPILEANQKLQMQISAHRIQHIKLNFQFNIQASQHHFLYARSSIQWHDRQKNLVKKIVCQSLEKTQNQQQSESEPLHMSSQVAYMVAHNVDMITDDSDDEKFFQKRDVFQSELFKMNNVPLMNTRLMAGLE